MTVCIVCHQEWTPDEIAPGGVCWYCWDTHADDWIGDDE